ncbi:hypothetical protein OEG88_13465 [Clostridium perfringens]|uniref:hypothetical protein n=1 Tax=Clostridium perfringens TaxID=1502 RepID=UPI000E120D06|nr:hypothetical protein [Clostridium perfringens]MDG6887975.1 hypothetical protein [Clostridium perfringens]MDH5079402.1 hypothetical protein [Clostridium perfringens]MDK0720718.1 hypothetical protein [Clostridium perfringens]MDK0768951.1 hypothetical protein [Clostridium perfringens]MDK0771646.1 hypothetical protein [Clostridium perfringens]
MGDFIKNYILGAIQVDFIDEDYEDVELRCKFNLEKKIDDLLDKYEYFKKEIQCTHDKVYRQIFYYKLEKLNDKLILKKIGQDPSFLEVNFYQYDNKYKKLKFYEEIKDDFKNSIHSYYEGLIVGAFTYLRRVLEKILEYKFNDIRNELEIDEVENFEKETKFAKKLKILKRYFPEYLTANTQIYSVLSKGVHKLSEEEANKYFEVVRSCVYIILNDFLNEQEDKKLKMDISKKINDINSEIKNN